MASKIAINGCSRFKSPLRRGPLVKLTTGGHFPATGDPIAGHMVARRSLFSRAMEEPKSSVESTSPPPTVSPMIGSPLLWDQPIPLSRDRASCSCPQPPAQVEPEPPPTAPVSPSWSCKGPCRPSHSRPAVDGGVEPPSKLMVLGRGVREGGVGWAQIRRLGSVLLEEVEAYLVLR